MNSELTFMAKIEVVYIERAVVDHPRVSDILARVKPKHVVHCEHYGEIFNRKRQDFREQKKAPALILAQKSGSRVLRAPEGYGIGGKKKTSRGRVCESYDLVLQNCASAAITRARKCWLQS